MALEFLNSRECLSVSSSIVSFGKSVNRIILCVCVLHLFLTYILLFSCIQMILYLAEASRHFGCTEIFKEPSKFAWSDYYEQHFYVPYDRIVLVTNKRVMLLQVSGVFLVDTL